MHRNICRCTDMLLKHLLFHSSSSQCNMCTADVFMHVVYIFSSYHTGWNCGTHGQNDTFCLQKALTRPKHLICATKANFALKQHNLQTNEWALPLNHYTADNKIQNTAVSVSQCTTACHCSLLLFVAFMPFVVTFAFLQRIGSRIRDALMQIILIPLILFSNCGWKLNTVNITQNTWKPK